MFQNPFSSKTEAGALSKVDQLQMAMFGKIVDVQPGQDPHVQWVTITPDIARLALEFNTDNRDLHKTNLAMLQEELRENGGLEAVTDGIGFAGDGTVVNGAHRLTAILTTGIAARLTVHWGTPKSSFAKHDKGNKRTRIDDATVIIRRADPTAKLKNKNNVASAVNLMLAGLEGPVPSNDEASTAIAHFHEMVNEVYGIVGRNPDAKNGGVLAAFMNAMRVDDQFRGPKGLRKAELVLAHAARLGTQSWAGDGDPMKKLHTRLQHMRQQKHEHGAAFSSLKFYAVTVSALRCALANRPMESRSVIPTTVDWGEASDTIRAGTEAIRGGKRNVIVRKHGDEAGEE